MERLVLAIETSCDETSVSIVRGYKVLSNRIASQIEMHQKWGGVVPEAAARAHLESIIPMLSEALLEANCKPSDLEGIAVTNRPGLIGALSVGVSAAKALAFALGIPLIGVDHLEGHLLAFLSKFPTHDLVSQFFPMVSLLVSGGHSELVLIHDLGKYQLLGQTRDDAAGEAFDKGARLMGLGYPGGKRIQELAVQGNPSRYSLPRGLEKERYEMSFSGLKTAILRLVESQSAELDMADAAASIQAAICDSLERRVANAIEDFRPASLGLCGGVAANTELRSRIQTLGAQNGIPVWIPDFELCTDNAAMIGIASQHQWSSSEAKGNWNLEPFPQTSLW